MNLLKLKASSLGCRTKKRDNCCIGYGIIFFLALIIPQCVFAAGETEVDVQTAVIPLESTPERAIERRIRKVLEHIEDFKNVNVSVNDGVVRLSGKASRTEVTQNAARMVSRFEGVIYVDNQIDVETDLSKRVSPAIERAQNYLTNTIEKLPSIGVAVLVIAVFWGMGRLVTCWDTPFRRLGLNRLLDNLIRQFLRKGIALIGILLALDILDLTSLVGAMLGTAGVIGLALGFAFKDIVENYLAGLLLSIRRPFGLNDFVRIESHEGKVIRLTSSELVLMTLDGNHVRIPNATVFKSFIYNYSINPRRRFDFTVGVGVDEDLLEVQSHGLSALKQIEGILEDPEPFMRVEDLGDFNVVVRFFGWVDQRRADLVKVKSEAIRRVKLTFDTAGVVMPEPIQNVRLQRLAAAPSMAKPPAAALQSTKTGHFAEAVDVSPDRQLDQQIKEDLAAAGESNLLIDK